MPSNGKGGKQNEEFKRGVKTLTKEFGLKDKQWASKLLEIYGGNLEAARSHIRADIEKNLSSSRRAGAAQPVAQPVEEEEEAQRYIIGSESLNSITRSLLAKADPKWRAEYESRDVQKQTQLICAKEGGAGQIWLGPRQVAYDRQDVSTFKFTKVLTVMDEDDRDRHVLNGEAQRLFLQVEDSVQSEMAMIGVLPIAVETLVGWLQADEVVYVHCASGLSRSATCCMAMLADTFAMKPMEAYGRVHKMRPCVNPNDGFFRALVRFVNDAPPKKQEERSYNAYQLVSQLAFLDNGAVTFEHAQKVLRESHWNAELAAGVLMAKFEPPSPGDDQEFEGFGEDYRDPDDDSEPEKHVKRHPAHVHTVSGGSDCIQSGVTPPVRAPSASNAGLGWGKDPAIASPARDAGLARETKPPSPPEEYRHMRQHMERNGFEIKHLKRNSVDLLWSDQVHVQEVRAQEEHESHIPCVKVIKIRRDSSRCSVDRNGELRIGDLIALPGDVRRSPFEGKYDLLLKLYVYRAPPKDQEEL